MSMDESEDALTDDAVEWLAEQSAEASDLEYEQLAQELGAIA